jgi:hypothetical protein
MPQRAICLLLVAVLASCAGTVEALDDAALRDRCMGGDALSCLNRECTNGSQEACDKMRCLAGKQEACNRLAASSAQTSQAAGADSACEAPRQDPGECTHDLSGPCLEREGIMWQYAPIQGRLWVKFCLVTCPVCHTTLATRKRYIPEDEVPYQDR